MIELLLVFTPLANEKFALSPSPIKPNGSWLKKSLDSKNYKNACGMTFKGSLWKSQKNVMIAEVMQKLN